MGPKSTGFERMIVLASGQCAPFDSTHCSPDATIRLNITDVRAGSPTGADYNPQGATDLVATATLPNYSGAATTGQGVQLTDKANSGLIASESGTTVRLSFPIPLTCAVTVDTTVGSTCTAQTTVNTLVPGAAQAGKRALWELGQLQVLDLGADGIAGNSDDHVFETEGYFVP